MIDQAEKLRTLVAKSSRDSNRLKRLYAEASLFSKTTSLGNFTTITVASGKGGVGKSNISLNLAISLSKKGKKVILLDADLGLANTHILCGVNPQFTLVDVVDGYVSILDTLVDGPAGMKIISSGNGIEKMANLDSIALEKLIRDLKHLENECEYLIIDTSAGISENVKAFLAAADKQIIVMTPEPTSLMDAYAALKISITYGSGDSLIVTNMVKSEKDGMNAYKNISLISKRFLQKIPSYIGAIPMDISLRKSVLLQKPALIAFPNSKFSVSINKVASMILGKKSNKKSNFFNKLSSYLTETFS